MGRVAVFLRSGWWARSKRHGAGAGVLAIVLAASCSHPLQLAPPIGDCDAGTKCGLPGGTSATGGGTRNDAASCGDIVYSNKVCDTCVTSRCCARDAKCSSNNDCIGILQCVNLCPATDMTCAQHCLDASPNGVADYNNFIVDCVNRVCGTECGASDGGGASCGTLPFATQACSSCVTTVCCTEDRLCSDNPSCLLIHQCAVNCPVNNQACISDCETLYPNGLADYRSLSACVVSGCGAKCP